MKATNVFYASVIFLVGSGVQAQEPSKVGEKATAQIHPPAVLTGRIIAGVHDGDESRHCEIEFSDLLPRNVAVGTKLGALVDVGELQNVTFWGRPADAMPNSQAAIFVLERDGHLAPRVMVRYGKISGPFIQVVEGLSPGDRVIITDLFRWTKYERVRIQ